MTQLRYFLVERAAIQKTKVNQDYLKVWVNTGDIKCEINLWQPSKDALKDFTKNTLFNCQGFEKEYGGNFSSEYTTVQFCIKTDLPDDHPILRIKTGSEVTSAILLSTFNVIWENTIVDEEWRKLYTLLDLQPYVKTMENYPASTTVHHCFTGGLVEHTLEVLSVVESLLLNPCFSSRLRPEIILLAALFHDFAKVLEYKADGEKTEQGYLLGHIYLGASKLEAALKICRNKNNINIPLKDIDKIIHCILAHHGQQDWGSPVVPCIPEASVLHYADQISAKLSTMEAATNMEYSRPLGTAVIK
jgi:3'-5' exoribonuclease